MNTNNTTESSFFEDDALFSENSFKELLEPIILPAGVSAESLAKIIAAIILRKSYLCSSAWSKWILLAALDEMLGKSAPILNEKQLHEIQGNQFEDSAVTSSGIGLETEIEVSPASTRSAGVNACNCSNNISVASPIRSSNVCVNENHITENFRDLTMREKKKRKATDEGFSSFNVGNKYMEKENEIEDCNTTVEQTSKACSIPSETNSLNHLPTLSIFKSRKDTPFVKDRPSSATQTECACLVDSATLTDHANLVDSSTLTDHANLVDSATLTDHANLVDSATLTNHVSLVDSATLTDHVSFVDVTTLTDHDSLVCLKCLFSLDEDQISYDNQPNIFTEDKSTQTDVIYRLIEISGISNKPRNRNQNKHRYIKNGEMIIKAFYGKPLLSQNSEFKTPIIPLEDYYGIDPRLFYSPGKQYTLRNYPDLTERTNSSMSGSSSPFMETHFTEDFNSSKETYMNESSRLKRKRPRLAYTDKDAADNTF